MVGSSREIWCSNRETGDFMKNLETPGKTGGSESWQVQVASSHPSGEDPGVE